MVGIIIQSMVWKWMEVGEPHVPREIREVIDMNWLRGSLMDN